MNFLPYADALGHQVIKHKSKVHLVLECCMQNSYMIMWHQSKIGKRNRREMDRNNSLSHQIRNRKTQVTCGINQYDHYWRTVNHESMSRALQKHHRGTRYLHGRAVFIAQLFIIIIHLERKLNFMPQDGNQFLLKEKQNSWNNLFYSIQTKYYFLATAGISSHKDQTIVEQEMVLTRHFQDF